MKYTSSPRRKYTTLEHGESLKSGITLLFCSFMIEVGDVGDGFLEFTQKQSHKLHCRDQTNYRIYTVIVSMVAAVQKI
jgi:hypothetical protein